MGQRLQKSGTDSGTCTGITGMASNNRVTTHLWDFQRQHTYSDMIQLGSYDGWYLSSFRGRTDPGREFCRADER